MTFRSLIGRYKVAERWLAVYSGLYWYEVDYYQLDEEERKMLGDLQKYEFYVDKVVNFFKMLPRKTLGVRILNSDVDVENETLGYIFSSSFEVAVPDIVLRENDVKVGVGDVIASAGVFDELAKLRSFEEFTKPVFVRFVQEIRPSVYVVQMNNVLEWRLRVSDSDVVFRLAV